ncbi:hypothetical protein ACP4I1_32090 [Streptomyces sp. WG4]|uniref:hypothetical protein n=1 Tax=Streptomyces sp. WG4 TaxID=3417649 RepID=UPI003CEE7C07
MQYTGTVISLRQARQIVANPQLAVYDNPNALLMCVYKREKALCHRGIKDTPSLDRCVAGCGNIARTDQHITKILDRADLLDRRAPASRARSPTVFAATRPVCVTSLRPTTAPESPSRTPHEPCTR